MRGKQRRKSETPYLDERAKEIIALEAFWNSHPEGDMRTMALMISPGTVEEAGGFVTQWAKKGYQAGPMSTEENRGCDKLGEFLQTAYWSGDEQQG